MSQPPVTRVELDTPITTGTIKLPESIIKQNVLSYPFVKISPINGKGKASGTNRKYLIYGSAFICIVGVAALIYTYQDRIKSIFGAKGNHANAQGSKKPKNGNRTTALVAPESSGEGEDNGDLLDIDEDIIMPSSEIKTKTKKQKNASSSNDIYFTPI